MTKKFSGSAKVWLAAHEVVLAGEAGLPLQGETAAIGDPDAARKLLDRALTSLPQRKHIKVRFVVCNDDCVLLQSSEALLCSSFSLLVLS